MMREKDIHIYIIVKFWGLPNQSFSFCPREIITEFELYSNEQPVVKIDAILIIRLYNREIDQKLFLRIVIPFFHTGVIVYHCMR